MTTVLIVEDEHLIADFVAKGLQRAGYDTAVAHDGRTGFDLAMRGEADLVILDVGLPAMDGFEVLQALRGHGNSIPVVMLTARSSTRDTVAGLDGGANDYIPKPFTVEELLARVRSRLREHAAVPETLLTHGDVVLDVLGRRAVVAGRDVELSSREFALAEQFLRNPGQVLTRDVLLSQVWGLDFDPGSNVVDVYVRYLRGKIGAHHIVTVRGAGYRWE